MHQQNALRYRDLFSGPQPALNDLLGNIPSKVVIGVMAMINDTITIRGQNQQTQEFILSKLFMDFREKLGVEIQQVLLYRVQSGCVIFAFPYTVEFINREFSNFREKIS